MAEPMFSHSEEVDHLLRNAQLRDELEPYFDESITRLNMVVLPTQTENEILASMLAWERAPIRPIAQWFDPELRLPHPTALDDTDLRRVLWDTVERLFSKRIVLDFTDHLSDRKLYQLIYRDILPAPEKLIDDPAARSYLHWDCADTAENPDIWLRYYANDEDRRLWAETNFEPLPEREDPPYPRQLPRAPFEE
jgi:hypothetical protein